MKKTINLLCRWHVMSFKTLLTFTLVAIFSPAFSQTTAPQGFNAGNERREAIKQGVHEDELEDYIAGSLEYYKLLENLNKKGRNITITNPPLNFISNVTTSCPGTFEDGTVLPWISYTSVNTGGISSYINNTAPFDSGEVINRHTIMTTGSYDSVVNTLPVVRPGGGQHSLKLGNKQNGKSVERVTQTVIASGGCISFWYALVFENPNHNYNDQPFFMFRLYDSVGNLLDSFVRQASTDSFFSTQSGGIVYRGWTKHTVKFDCEYIGTPVRIEFTTADCRLGAHMGYAYIDDVCFENCCCETCEDVINMPELYNTHPVFVYKGSTENECCYALNLPLIVAMPFKCNVYGLKIYEEGKPGSPYSSYQGTQDVQGFGFLQSIMDFCIHKDSFTAPKTIVLALYDFDGNLICDSIKRVIEPCYTSTGCNCEELFSNPNFAQTTTIKKDTGASNETNCCFTFTPFRDSSIIKCPYYGFRVYREGFGQYQSGTYIDTVNSSTPIGGPGAPTANDTFKFCIGSYLFDSIPVPIRIEYLDSTGKVICSKVENVSCEESCCEDITFFVKKDTTETDPINCCYRVELWAFGCNKTHTAEIMKQTDTGWVSAGTDTFNITRPIFFDLCAPNGDTINYMIFVKDSSGNVICTKQFSQSCPNCCDLLYYTATYVPPLPFADRCCWDIYVSPTASMECNVWNWGVYDSLHNVPSSYPLFLPPHSPLYQGRHCTPIILAPNPAPGTSITITYCITRYLAVYDNMGVLLCIKPIELCCTRTYSNPGPGGPDGPFNIEVAPNPFNESFTMSMNVPQEMPVTVNIINSSGSSVFEQNYGIQPAGIFTREISLAGLPAGIYLLSVNNGQASIQIVKQ